MTWDEWGNTGHPKLIFYRPNGVDAMGAIRSREPHMYTCLVLRNINLLSGFEESSVKRTEEEAKRYVEALVALEHGI